MLQISEKNGHVDLEKLIRTLGEKKIDSILVEGGGTSTVLYCKQDL